ncbi:MAG: DGQHR domain-containing protein [Oceanicaulis sp.]
MNVKLPALELNQNGKKFYLTALTASQLAEATYVARRGHDNEPGAVQRVLNKRRISGIRDFILAGGAFPNSVVLNWRADPQPKFTDNKLEIQLVHNAAQVIDGQHRIEALREAILEQQSVGMLEVPVAVFTGLGDQECADIFLSINTEQKPVPRSLVIDLFGIASKSMIDPAAERARDIVVRLNEDERSPYAGLIKLPGEPQRRGGIALSTAATALKGLVEPKGDFEIRGIHELEIQYAALLNYFSAIKEHYGSTWNSNKNAFMFAAGFSGAIEFFKSRMLPYCQDRMDFTVSTIYGALGPLSDDLIYQGEVSGVQGKEAPQKIHERLISLFEPDKVQRGTYKL